MKVKLRIYKQQKKLKVLPLKVQYEILDNLYLFLTKGYSLNECLHILQYKYNLEKYIQGLKAGKRFSEILAINDYDTDVLLIIDIAEKSENLKKGIKSAKSILKKKMKAKNMLFELLKYPLLLGMIIFVVLSFVGIFLIPQFEAIYTTLDIELNAGIKVLFNVINVIPLLLIIIVIGCLVGIVSFKKMPFEKQVDIISKHKILQSNYQKVYNHVFVINIANLLAMGLRIDQIFIIMKNQSHNQVLKKESVRILGMLTKGMLLHETLTDKLYSKELIYLIKEAEKNQSLVYSLENYAIFLEKNQNHQIKKIVFWIQPLFYGAFGMIIVLLYVSIFMPMFEMMNTI